MAELPELDQLIEQEQGQLLAKAAEFHKQGKEFVLDPYGPGVVPDHIYDALRDPKDPKYKKGYKGKADEGKIAKIADGDRVYPVDHFILHHSVGPAFTDVDHDTIAQWFSDVGRTRMYAGIAHSGHYYKGRETFAPNQLAGHWHNNEWCIFECMDDIWNNVGWCAGNWAINQRAINIENCGRFTAPADDKILRALARWWKPQHDKLGGNTRIAGHTEVSLSSTACPERLKEGIPAIRSYMSAPTPPPAPAYNFVDEVGKARVTAGGDDLFFLDAPFLNANVKGSVPDGTVMDYVGYTTQGSNVEGDTKWWKNAYGSWFSAKYAVKVEAPAPPAPTPPAPTPTPPAPTPPAPVVPPEIKYEPLPGGATEYVAIRDGNFWNFNKHKHADMENVTAGNKKQGDKVLVFGTASHPTGSKYLMTAYSFSNSGKSPVPYKTTGYNDADFKPYVPTPPTPPTPTPTPPGPGPVPIEPIPPASEETVWDILQKLWTKFQEWAKKEKW